MIKIRKEIKVPFNPMDVCQAMFIVGTYVHQPKAVGMISPVEILPNDFSDSGPEYLWSVDKSYIIVSWGMGSCVLYQDGEYSRLDPYTPEHILDQIKTNLKKLKK